MSSVSVVIIGFNTKKYLKGCLDSLYAQELLPDEILYIDNSSEDDSIAFVTENYPNAEVIANKDNKGYAGAANQGINLSKGTYVMIANPDLILEPGYINECVSVFEREEKAGAVTGKLKQYDSEQGKTGYIDTTGLLCFRKRRFVDRGQGFPDTGQFEQEEEVFGVSGAAPIYRRSALDACSVQEDYFDEDFFMYKEDIDLSWRLRLFGYTCWYTPKAVGYHIRGTGVKKQYTDLQVAAGRKDLSNFQKTLSFRNQRLMQIKNELPGSFLRDILPILWKEILIFGYMIVREPVLFKAWWQFFKLLSRALTKRKEIMKRKKVKAAEMNKWLHGSNKQPT